MKRVVAAAAACTPAAAACAPTAAACSQTACSQPAAARPQITNTAKLKRMSKKQLKMVRKADTRGVAPKDVARHAIIPKIGGKPGKGRR